MRLFYSSWMPIRRILKSYLLAFNLTFTRYKRCLIITIIFLSYDSFQHPHATLKTPLSKLKEKWQKRQSLNEKSLFKI